jgi:hypothetical protein
MATDMEPVYVRLKPELKETLLAMAAAEHRSINNFIAKVLIDFIGSQEPPKFNGHAKPQKAVSASK